MYKFQAFHNFLKRAAEQNGSAQVANITTVGGSLALARDQYYSPPTTYAMSKVGGCSTLPCQY